MRGGLTVRSHTADMIGAWQVRFVRFEVLQVSGWARFVDLISPETEPDGSALGVFDSRWESKPE